VNVCQEMKWTKLQTERLIETVKRVYHNVPLYREKMQKKGIEPGDIKTLDDLKKLPFTYKDDLRDNISLWYVCRSAERNCKNTRFLPEQPENRRW